jgi:hypothetical protein
MVEGLDVGLDESQRLEYRLTVGESTVAAEVVPRASNENSFLLRFL